MTRIPPHCPLLSLTSFRSSSGSRWKPDTIKKLTAIDALEKKELIQSLPKENQKANSGIRVNQKATGTKNQSRPPQNPFKTGQAPMTSSSPQIQNDKESSMGFSSKQSQKTQFSSKRAPSPLKTTMQSFTKAEDTSLSSSKLALSSQMSSTKSIPIGAGVIKKEKEDEIQEFLQKLGMEKFKKAFIDFGFETYEDLYELDTETLNLMKIPAGFQIKIMKRIDQVQHSVDLSKVQKTMETNDFGSLAVAKNLDYHLAIQKEEENKRKVKMEREENREMSIGTDPIDFENTGENNQSSFGGEIETEEKNLGIMGILGLVEKGRNKEGVSKGGKTKEKKQVKFREESKEESVMGKISNGFGGFWENSGETKEWEMPTFDFFFSDPKDNENSSASTPK